MRANDNRDVAILHGHALRDLCQAPCNNVVYQIQKLWVLWIQRTFFHAFPIVSLWQAMTPWGGAFMDPRGTVDKIYEEGYYALLHTKKLKLWVLWFRIKSFVHVFLL